MRLAAAVIAVGVALVTPAVGRAQPVSSLSGPGPDTWIELHLGAAVPQHQDLDVTDPGYAVGGTFGARFLPWLGAEAEVGYWRATGKESGIRVTASDLPVKANVRLRTPWKVVELSAAAGVGLHFTSLTVEPAAPGSPSGSAVAFGFQVGAGIGFHLSPTMLVGAAVERSFVEPKLDGDRVRFDALRVAATLSYHL